mmetsp:Transcript_44072/g.141325  ORF Transcript_44072/g.141325 Transcript_44072/m.141325 type:complete len:118 (+) Transcript_44072:357-710(+)
MPLRRSSSVIIWGSESSPPARLPSAASGTRLGIKDLFRCGCTKAGDASTKTRSADAAPTSSSAAAPAAAATASTTARRRLRGLGCAWQGAMRHVGRPRAMDLQGQGRVLLERAFDAM